MADFLLQVGINTSQSFTQMQKDIRQLVSDLNKTPPKIKIDIDETDLDKKLNSVREKLSEISNLSANTSSVNSVGATDAAGIRKVASAWRQLTKDMNAATEAASRASSAINSSSGGTGVQATAAEIKNITVGTTEYYTALNRVNTLITQITVNLEKWNAAQNGKTSGDYSQLETYKNELSALRWQMESGTVSAEQYAESMARIRAGVASSSGAIKSAGEAMAANSAKSSTALTQVSTLLAQVNHQLQTWTAAKNGKSSQSYQELVKAKGELEALYATLIRGGAVTEDFDSKMKGIRGNVTAAGTAIRAAGENTKTFGQRIGSLSAKFASWLTITQVIMYGYRAIRTMVSNVVELDTAMTELKKVTDETADSYDRFLNRAGNRSKELGASLSDTVNATADFARLGYNVEDAEKLADAAIVYKNVGDGISDIGEASESIISTMQAFNVPAEEAMTIVDKFNEVGNKFAISSKGVGDALLRSASAMQAAGNTIDETIALATAANEVVQDAEKVGTSLKTMSMRLRGADTAELEEAGLATDGMAKSVSKLRQELLLLTGNKVDIQIDEDTFKSTYQIMQDLAKVWNELTDISQANILEKIAGKRNANTVAALLSNFSTAEKVLGVSAGSAGSALAENEKVLDSIQGKLNVLKATFQDFSQSLINSKFIGTVVSSLTGLLELLNNITNTLGSVGTVAATTFTVLAVGLKMNKFEKLAGRAKMIALKSMPAISCR